RFFHFGSYRPTPAQELLLQASLLKEKAALTAWEQWRSSVDIEVLDAESYVLLPQLYQNLLAHGVEDPHMARLKGIYRRNWCANQLQIKALT
ncbi:MAG: nucleotidyltransferase family protein, partial [Nostoc sp.]